LKPKKTFYNWLTSRYLLIIRNEENFAEKTTLSFNYAKLILFIVAVFAVFLTLSLSLSKTLLATWFDPQRKEIEINKKIAELSLAVDSLALEVDNKEKFIQTLKKIMDEDKDFLKTKQKDSLNNNSAKVDISDPSEIEAIDKELRDEFENADMEALPVVQSKKQSDLQSFFLFPPISGIVMSKYNSRLDHFGIDVVSQANEPIRSVSDGTVTMSSWTQDAGYVLAIQHRNNLISIYKHNSALLQKVGDYVKAGDVVSIIGNTGELTNGPHLHFELWHDGMPINPEEFVSF
jgi:murein DD-endopeptidase MepM/ murein hydrolase activator NlpD